MMQTQPHLTLAASNPPAVVGSFEEIVELCESQREPILAHHLTTSARVVAFEPGRLTLNSAHAIPAEILKRVSGFLERATGQNWRIVTSDMPGAATLAQQRADAKAQVMNATREHRVVKAVLDAFPGATLEDVRPDDR